MQISACVLTCLYSSLLAAPGSAYAYVLTGRGYRNVISAPRPQNNSSCMNQSANIFNNGVKKRSQYRSVRSFCR
jgi:hypothetical protein